MECSWFHLPKNTLLRAQMIFSKITRHPNSSTHPGRSTSPRSSQKLWSAQVLLSGLQGCCPELVPREDGACSAASRPQSHDRTARVLFPGLERDKVELKWGPRRAHTVSPGTRALMDRGLQTGCGCRPGSCLQTVCRHGHLLLTRCRQHEGAGHKLA